MRPRLFLGGLSGRVYLSTRYRERAPGQFEAISKTDITDEFERTCLAYLAALAGEDGHKYLADGLAVLVERVNGRPAEVAP